MQRAPRHAVRASAPTPVATPLRLIRSDICPVHGMRMALWSGEGFEQLLAALVVLWVVPQLSLCTYFVLYTVSFNCRI